MVISRSLAASQAVSGLLHFMRFMGNSLPLQEQIKILGVAPDCCLSFDLIASTAARQTSQRVFALRRVIGNLDSGGTDAAMYGVRYLDMYVECCHP